MTTRDTMELREEDVRAHYPAANEMLSGLDHAPRIATVRPAPAAPERSPGIAASGRCICWTGSHKRMTTTR